MATAPQQITTQINHITHQIIAAAMRVHTALGPGLLESAYRACLLHELRNQGFSVASEVGLPVVYRGEKIDLGYRIDLVVADCVIVEIKCVEAINPVHKCQLLSYMRLSGREVGLLINFHVEHLKDGIKRMVDGYEWQKASTTESTELHREMPQRLNRQVLSGRTSQLKAGAEKAPAFFVSSDQ
jgi:GxxExxY protein